LELADDAALPGRSLLNDAGALSELLGLVEPLQQSLSTYRFGRRAVLRVASAAGGRGQFVKLLSRKAFRKAKAALEVAIESGCEYVVTPREVREDTGVLVFNEVCEPALHERIWAGSEPDWLLIVSALRDFAAAEIDVPLPTRNLETVRAATVRSLETAIGFLPDLQSLLEAVERIELPVLEGSEVVHGDLHDKQIFLRRSDIRLIDAETLARGPSEIDLVNLTEHIRLRGLQGCEGAEGLAAGLWRATGVDRRRREVMALTALVRARLAGVYARRPWWWGVSLALGADAAKLLEEL